MDAGDKRAFKLGGSFFGGFLIVLILTVGVRPLQKDNAHTQGVLTAKGGTVIHGAHFERGSDFFGRYTVLVTGSVTPPIAGDIKVELTGPGPVNYQLSSRFPPKLPLLNLLRPWYRFEDNTLKGIKPGDSVAVYAKIFSPETMGEYKLTFTDVKTQKVYLAMPIEFSKPAGASGAEEGEACH